MDRNPLKHTLYDYVCLATENYLKELDGQPPVDLYHMVLAEVETALIKTILAHCHQNQSKAAEYLGLNRGTLRKKLKDRQIEPTGK